MIYKTVTVYSGEPACAFQHPASGRLALGWVGAATCQQPPFPWDKACSPKAPTRPFLVVLVLGSQVRERKRQEPPGPGVRGSCCDVTASLLPQRS